MKIVGDDNGDQPYNAAFTPESRATGTPWVNLTRDQARTECQGLGANYDLPTNAEWQTLAQNIELVGWNWNNGVVGDSGGLSRSLGMTSGVAASDDTDSCVNTGHTCSLSTWDAYRRVQQLSNGEYIWDLAGNVGEWVGTPWPDRSEYAGGGVAISQLAANATKKAWGPSGNYVALNAEPFGGLGEATGATSNGTLERGGAWGAGTTTLKNAGIFSASANVIAPNDSVGFRCVYRPTAVTTQYIYSPEILPVTSIAADATNLELGVKFQSDVAGSIYAIRFYRGVGNVSGYTVNLWTNAGVNLATATGTDGAIPGWQEIAFASPIAISAGTTYVASYYTQGGQYSYSTSILTSSFSNGFHLTAEASGGVYNVGSGFPSSIFGTPSYFVDVKFVPGP